MSREKSTRRWAAPAAGPSLCPGSHTAPLIAAGPAGPERGGHHNVDNPPRCHPGKRAGRGDALSLLSLIPEPRFVVTLGSSPDHRDMRKVGRRSAAVACGMPEDGAGEVSGSRPGGRALAEEAEGSGKWQGPGRALQPAGGYLCHAHRSAPSDPCPLPAHRSTRPGSAPLCRAASGRGSAHARCPELACGGECSVCGPAAWLRPRSAWDEAFGVSGWWGEERIGVLNWFRLTLVCFRAGRALLWGCGEAPGVLGCARQDVAGDAGRGRSRKFCLHWHSSDVLKIATPSVAQ